MNTYQRMASPHTRQNMPFSNARCNSWRLSWYSNFQTLAMQGNLGVYVHHVGPALFPSSVVHTLMSLALCLFRQGWVLSTPGCAASLMDTAQAIRILPATPGTIAAKIPQLPDPSFYVPDVVRVPSQSRKSFTMFSDPGFQGVYYAGKLIRNGFVGTQLVLCHPKQFVEQRRNIALVPQHTSFHQTWSESEYSVEYPNTRRH